MVERSDYIANSFERMRHTFRERDSVYGDAPRLTGELARCFFDLGEVTHLTRAQDFERMFYVLTILCKLARYANCYNEPYGHPDSLEDAAVYLTMLQQLDYADAEERGNLQTENCDTQD